MPPPRTLPWARTDRIGEVRDRIWSYITPSSERAHDLQLLAAALLRWPLDDARVLGELHFLASEEVQHLLDAMPQLVRRLTNASTRVEESTGDRLRGPVQWQSTFAARAVTGTDATFVTAPATRVYQTAENELLVHVLDALVWLGHSTGWVERPTPGGLGRQVHDRARLAERWQGNRILQSVNRIQPSERSVDRVRRGRASARYGPVITAYTRLRALVQDVDRAAIRESIEQTGLAVASDGTLFELLTLFEIIDSLSSGGWKLSPLGLLRGGVHVRGTHADGRPIELWYQTTPRRLSTGSRYVPTLSDHGLLANAPLRPDFTLCWKSRSGQLRTLIVECKLARSGVTTAARRALSDLYAYRYNYDAVLKATDQPFGLGVAWGRELKPSVGSDVALCSPDTLLDAIGCITSV